MGDNIRLIRWHAFYNTSNLKEIVIGSGLYTLESDVFNCPALTSFTCTATQPAEGYYPGLEIPNARVFGDCDISNITFYGMHSGAFHYSVWTVGFALGGGKRNYIGLDAHSDPTWTWAADLSSAEAVFACNDCDYAGTQPATVTSEVTTQPTWTTPGVRTYTASVIVTGVTYTDTRTEEIPVLTYTVTVNGGTADKASATAGESVTITANAPGTGKRFKEWTGADGLAFTSGSAATATATFTMPANAVTLTATYEDIYSVTVNGGTTDKASAAEGESVTITANEPEYGKRFKEWTGADGLTFTGGSSAASSTATFTMPGRAVTLAATYETSPTTIVTVEFGEGHGDFAAARFGSVEGFTVTGTTLTYSVVLDSTIGDAKKVFSSKADFYPPAVDDGELFTDDLALNPAGYYASLAEVNAERSAWDGQPVPVEGLKFYAQWEKPVGAVTVSVTAPDPGTEVTVSGNEPMRRTDPQVSVSVTGNVTLDTASGANWWTDYDGTYYSGTVASGQACYARFYVPLKGCVLKELYPKIGMRQMADNDILIDASRTADVKKIMEGLGFSSDGYTGRSVHDHYMKPPVCNFEMHRMLFGPMHNARISEYYLDVKSRLIQNDGCRYGYHLSDADFYVYMIAHEFKHYSGGGTGLRSVLDTYVYLKKKSDALDWGYISGEINKLGIAEFETQNRSLALHLFDSDGLSEKDEEMLEYILSSGTYGTVQNRVKNGIRKYGSGTFGKLRYVISRLFLPIDTVRSAFPLFGKYPILLPFLPFYRVFRALKSRKGRLQAEMKALIERKRQQ